MTVKLALNIAFSLILVAAIVSISGCIGDDDTITWKEFITDYVDTDDDGERDDFSSYEVGDTVIIRDKVKQIGGNAIQTEITFESYSDEVLVFYGGATSINTGERIEVTIKIVSGTGDGGAVIEDYSAEQIEFYE